MLYGMLTHRRSYRVECLCNSPVSSESIESCTSYFSQNIASKNYDNLYIHAPQKYPWIKDLSIQFQANGIACCSISAALPVCVIGNKYLLLDNKKSVSIDTYDTSCTSSLYSITSFSNIQTYASLLHALYDWITSQEQDFFLSFDMAIKDKHTFCIKDRSEPLVFLVSAYEKDSAVISRYYAAAKNYLANIKKNPRKKQELLIADLRFKDYIVFYADKGGDYDSIC